MDYFTAIIVDSESKAQCNMCEKDMVQSTSTTGKHLVRKHSIRPPLEDFEEVSQPGLIIGQTQTGRTRTVKKYKNRVRVVSKKSDYFGLYRTFGLWNYFRTYAYKA